MRRGWLLAVGVLVGGAGGPARAHLIDTRTGASLEVRVPSRPPGIEARIPRGGAYEKALLAVRAGQYRQARQQFMAAEEEVARLAERGDLGFPLSRTLALKARFEALCVSTLLDDGKETLQSSMGLSKALAMHNLYLTTVAYFGKPDDDLFVRTQRAYRAVLTAGEADSRWNPLPTHVALAALLAAGGERDKAALEMSRIPPAAEAVPELFHLFAAYHAASGDAERTFRILDAARDAAPSWSAERIWMRVGNDFDNLRDDPRFSRLLGDDE